GSLRDSRAASPSRGPGRPCGTPCAPCGSPSGALLVSIRDRQLAHRVLVPQAASLHRVVQLDLEALASADLSAHGERAAEHRGPRGEKRGTREAPEQIAWRAHVARLALLVEPALAG